MTSSEPHRIFKMPERRSAWLAGLLVVLAATAILNLVPGAPSDLWLRVTLDIGHLPLFALLALVWLRTSFTLWGPFAGNWLLNYVIALIAMAMLGGALELLQSLVGRSVSIEDYGRNVAGASVALLFSISADAGRYGDPPRSHLARLPARFLAVAMLVLAGWPMITMMQAYRGRASSFPVIYDAAEPWTREFVSLRRAEISGESASDGRPATKIVYQPAAFPAFILREPLGDWSDFDQLLVEVEIPERGPRWLDIRIDDEAHDGRYSDRFHRRVELNPGAQTLSLALSDVKSAPAERSMDLEQIRSLTLFVADNSGRCELVLKRIRLVGSDSL